MSQKQQEIRYPENRYLKVELVKAGKSATEIAKAIGVSRGVVSLTINGHYKGINVVPAIKKELGI